MTAELLDMIAVPVALLESDGLTLRSANRCFFEWVPGIGPGQSLVAFHRPFGQPRAMRAVERGREHCVAGEVMDHQGRPRAVDFRRRPVDLDGEALWLLEGLDQAKAQVFQTLLETHACIIEKNNRMLAARERELEAATEQMRRVLDNTNEGLFIVDLEGRVGDARSKACARWFKGAPGVSVVDYLGSFDSKAAAWFELSFSAVRQGVLPHDVSLDQLPTHLNRDGTYLKLSYVPICGDDGELVNILVVASDMTETLKVARAQQQERDFVELTRRLLRDRAGLEQFIEEVNQMLGRLCQPGIDPEEAMRLLHTIKGNCALFGAAEFSRGCHELESRVQQAGLMPSSAEAQELKNAWDRAMSPIRQMMESNDRSLIELSDRELTDFIQVIEGATPAQMRAIAKSWRNPPVKNMLRLLGEQTIRLARGLDKDIEVVVRDNAMRLPMKRWRSFWTALVHVLRNALDHGLEPPDERERLGKRRSGLITLETKLSGNEIQVRVTDDGPGIPWVKVEENYRARVGEGGPPPTRDTLVAELLRSGFSTRDEVSEISGRGVGLDAVAAACRRVGGIMDIDSEPGCGTRFVFRFSDPELVAVIQASQSVASRRHSELLGADESSDVVRSAGLGPASVRLTSA